MSMRSFQGILTSLRSQPHQVFCQTASLMTMASWPLSHMCMALMGLLVHAYGTGNDSTC